MKNTGFSLVELLVVIAIMAVLAGVAVPVYSAYTENAKAGVDQNILNEIAHVADLEAAKNGATVTEIVITIGADGTVSSVDVTCDLDSVDLDVNNWSADGTSMMEQVVQDVTMQSKTYKVTSATKFVFDDTKDEWVKKQAATS